MAGARLFQMGFEQPQGFVERGEKAVRLSALSASPGPGCVSGASVLIRCRLDPRQGSQATGWHDQGLVNGETDMNWRRVAGYGVALWALPFSVSFVLFGIRESNRALFESLITVVVVALAVAAALYYFRDSRVADLRAGLTLGIAWAAISVVIDLPIFLAVFHMSLPDYAADIALTYLAFPAITTGIALAHGRGAAA